MIDGNKISRIINSFAAGKKIFSREVQLQFDLAWEIRKDYPKYDVVLEYLWEKEKWYIDIVVFSDQERKCVPIELKYKTTDREIEYKVNENETYMTYNQGAPDVGSYDYIKDIYRLENLGKSLKYKGKEYEVERGYAIILTNDWHYYEDLPSKGEREKYNYFYWEKFSLAQEKISGDINWINPINGELDSSGEHTSKDRRNGIQLTNEYHIKCKWKAYDIGDYSYKPKMKKKPDFKYLITEVNPVYSDKGYPV